MGLHVALLCVVSVVLASGAPSSNATTIGPAGETLTCGCTRELQEIKALMEKQQVASNNMWKKMELKMDLMSSKMTVKELDCLGGYQKMYDSCIKIVWQTMTWNSARDTCHQDGGHLLTITSKEQNAAIGKVMDHLNRVDNYWIGGNDLGKEGTWVWEASNDVVSYSNWRPGEPNNHGGQNCMTFHALDKQWDDDKCDHASYPFICEK